MKGQVALGGFEVIRVSELGDQIEYSDTAPLMLAGKVLARTNNYYPNYHSTCLSTEASIDAYLTWSYIITLSSRHATLLLAPSAYHFCVLAWWNGASPPP